MKELTQEASDRMLAEFMEWTIEPGMENEPNPYYNFANGWKMVLVSQMEFSTSWDWLMPVVEKISAMKIPDPEIEYWQPFPRTFGMTNEDTGEFMFRFNRHCLHEAPTLIEAAYSAVVELLSGLSEKGGKTDE